MNASGDARGRYRLSRSWRERKLLSKKKKKCPDRKGKVGGMARKLESGGEKKIKSTDLVRQGRCVHLESSEGEDWAHEKRVCTGPSTRGN